MSHDSHWLATADGVKLFQYRWLGAAEAKAGVVICHGFIEHAGRYGHLAEALNRQGYMAYAADLRGHGRSEGERGFVSRFEEYLIDIESSIEAARQHLGPKPLFLVGHSMGGLISMSYALRENDQLRGVVASGPAVCIADRVFPLLRKLARIVATVWPRLRLVRMGVNNLSRDPQAVRAFESDPLVFHGRFPARTGAEILRAGAALLSEARRLETPLLVLQGEADAVVDPAGAGEAYRRAGSGDKTLRSYPGLYHALFHEPERDAIIDEVIQWLDRRL